MANNGPSRDGAERLSADDRREALLEVTKALVLERGAAAITMGAVAERAEVTRALVYKHFANSEELLASLYRRESTRLDRAMSDVVSAAPGGFEAKLRALVRAALGASEEHGMFFTPLRAFGSQPDAKTDRRSWDRRTVRYFAQLAEDDFGVDQRTARAAIAVQLSGLHSLLSQLRARPGAEQRGFLEHVYVEGAIGALTRLACPPTGALPTRDENHDDPDPTLPR